MRIVTRKGTPGSPRVPVGFTLAAMVFATFGSVVLHQFVVWGDLAAIVDNPVVADWWGASWRDRLVIATPLPTAIYAVFGLAGPAGPFLIHLTALVVHAASAFLLSLLAGRWLCDRRWGAVAAAIWGLHPVMTESVAWASNLGTVLATFGVLLSLWGWDALADGRPRGGPALGAGSLLAVVSMPLGAIVAPLLAVRATTAGQWSRPRATVVALIALLHGAWLLTVGLPTMAIAPTDAVAAVGLHAKNYVVLGSNEPLYDLAEGRPRLLATGAAAVAAWLVLLAVSWRKGSRTGSWLLTALAVAWLPYAALDRVTRDSDMALPSVFVAAGLVCALTLLATRASRIAPAIALIAVSSCAFASWHQVDRWRSTEALFGPLLGDPQRVALPYALVAHERHLLGDPHHAVALLEEAWEPLAQARDFPGFAAEAFLEAEMPGRAAQAQVLWLQRGGIDGERARAALTFLDAHDLPIAAEWHETLAEAWRAFEPQASEEAARIDRYLKRQGVPRSSATPHHGRQSASQRQ